MHLRATGLGPARRQLEQKKKKRVGLATLEIFCFLLLGIRVEKCHVDRVDYFHLLVSIEDWFQELLRYQNPQMLRSHI